MGYGCGRLLEINYLQELDFRRLRTLTRQTVMPFLVSVQKRDLRGLEIRESTGSGGILGSGGTVQRRFADDVGKYIQTPESLLAPFRHKRTRTISAGGAQGG
jgi:hypothetical protein